MGAAATVEVSFVDKETGKLMTEEQIRDISKTAEEIVDSFDFSSDFYRHFNQPDAYAQLAIKWQEESKKVRTANFWEQNE
jgi:hypothetical protein